MCCLLPLRRCCYLQAGYWVREQMRGCCLAQGAVLLLSVAPAPAAALPLPSVAHQTNERRSVSQLIHLAVPTFAHADYGDQYVQQLVGLLPKDELMRKVTQAS